MSVIKEYLMNIAGAVIITVFAEVLLPDKWNKYIKIITGLIIISAIAAPIKEKINFDISDYSTDIEDLQTDGEEYSKRLVIDELCERISTDCEERLSEEFGISAEAECRISVNESNEITGVEAIEITGENISEKAVERIKEIYAPQEVIANGN